MSEQPEFEQLGRAIAAAVDHRTMSAAEVYVRTMAELMADMNARGGEKQWRSMPEFIALYGREWKWEPKPKHIRAGTIKQCFDNAYQLARRNPELTYVEGYACGLIPVHHAWVVTPEGIVIDHTWKEEGRWTQDERAYFGVAFPTDYVTKRRREQLKWRGTSVLDDMGSGHPTLRRDFDYEAIRPEAMNA